MKNKPINHAKLGGNTVDLHTRVPQRKTDKTLTPEEMITKAFKGTYKETPKDVWEDVGK